MTIPTPKNAPIKRHLTEEDRGNINSTVLDGNITANTASVEDIRAVGRGTKPSFPPREHLMQRPFAKDPAFAELARQTRENQN